MTEATRTVLVVDDDPDMRSMLVDCLTEEGYRVLAAADAFAALDIARHQRLDAVVSDVAMPGMDGTQMVAAIRGEGLALPVVLMSAHSAPRSLPDVPLLRKPFALDDLVALLNSIRGSPQRRSVASRGQRASSIVRR